VQRIPLADYAAKRHAQTAKRLGMSQGALSKAIREGRQIFVTEAPDGAICAVEEKPFPSQCRVMDTETRGNDSSGGTTKTAPNVPVQPPSAEVAQ
jgi:hypothetical protein